jgi:hypothetical protein
MRGESLGGKTGSYQPNDRRAHSTHAGFAGHDRGVAGNTARHVEGTLLAAVVEMPDSQSIGSSRIMLEWLIGTMIYTAPA